MTRSEEVIQSEYKILFITIEENSSSVEYYSRSSLSWQSFGWHNTNPFPATVPRTMNNSLNFGKKMSGRDSGRDFTPTEKAVWHSHYACWKHIAKGSSNTIVAEHDIIMQKPFSANLLDSMLKTFPLINLSNVGPMSGATTTRISAGGCYAITPTMAKYLVRNVPETIESNSDGYLFSVMMQFGAFLPKLSTQLLDVTLGTTIDHLPHNNPKFKPDPSLNP